MKTSNNAAIPLVVGVLFIALGLLTFIGLMTFAIPCTRILAGTVARCYSLGLIQRGFAVVVIALGALVVAFRRSCEWVKALTVMVFLLGILLSFNAAVVTDTCNIRAHNLAISEAPYQANMRVHHGLLETDENIYVVWTNFDCNEGPFVPFVASMGIILAIISAIYAFFANAAALPVKPSPRNMGIGFIAMGAFILIGLFTFVPPCFEPAPASLNYKPMLMRCFDVAAHIYGIAAIIVFAGGLMILFGRSKIFHKGLSTSLGLLGALAIVITFLTNTCVEQDMICNVRPFKPFIQLTGALTLIMSLVNAFVLNRKEEEEDDEQEEIDG
ncbi:MAG: DUF4418 family protein [Treponema sp.]|nr:DUF4418 family protein [Treponema sp.]